VKSDKEAFCYLLDGKSRTACGVFPYGSNWVKTQDLLGEIPQYSGIHPMYCSGITDLKRKLSEKMLFLLILYVFTCILAKQFKEKSVRLGLS
jgi:hypothetical protein